MIHLLCICDELYFKYFIVLYRSCIKYNQQSSVIFHLYLINFNNKINITFPDNVIIKYKNNKCSRKIDIPNHKKNTGYYSEHIAYCANIRGEVINELLLLNIQYIIYIDVDSIIRNDISNIINEVDDNDIAVYNSHGYKSGIMVIRNNTNSKIFYNKYAAYILRHGIYKWYSDQRALLDTITELNYIKIKQLNVTYIDWRFNDNSIIWAGKGNCKYNNIKYTSEYTLYITPELLVNNIDFIIINNDNTIIQKIIKRLKKIPNKHVTILQYQSNKNVKLFDNILYQKYNTVRNINIIEYTDAQMLGYMLDNINSHTLNKYVVLLFNNINILAYMPQIINNIHIITNNIIKYNKDNWITNKYLYSKYNIDITDNNTINNDIKQIIENYFN
jgi:hypothetical protein